MATERTAFTIRAIVGLMACLCAELASAASIFHGGFDGGLYRSNLDGTETQLVSGVPFYQGIDVDESAGRIYTTSVFPNSIYSLRKDGSDVRDITPKSIDAPDDIAVDQVGRKMYWAQPNDLKIFRADFDGSNTESIITLPAATHGPRGIAFDSEHQKIYWTSQADGVGAIGRSNADGTVIETVFEGRFIERFDVAVDSLSGKLYWTRSTESNNANGLIQRADLDGSNVETVLSDLGFEDNLSGLAVDPLGSKIYWYGGGSYSIERANLDGSGREPLHIGGILALDLSPVPEPSTLLLAGCGLLALVALHRRIRGT